MMIEDFIPDGHENTISRRELARLLNVDDRTLRDMIEDARARGTAILNMQDGKGYFIPIKGKEERLADIWKKQQCSRVMKILKGLNGVNNFLSVPPGQIDITDVPR